VLDNVILSLDSSTIRASVAIARNNEILSEVFINRQKSHSEKINCAIEEVLNNSKLQLTDINAIAVTQGPGSFTGLRVSGNIAKTLSYVLNVPLISVSTLEALALQVAKDSVEIIKICPMVNAFKRMVFLALYDSSQEGHLVEQVKPGVFTLEQLESIITKNMICIGDAFDYYKEELSDTLVQKLERNIEFCDYPLPKSIVKLALVKLASHQSIVWNQFAPLYLKPSEAEENLRKGLLHVRRLT
jgi:tRNA threonylcarbamoyladenosine biosynthesis protein TsaB